MGKVLLSVILLVVCVNAWWEGGHMLTAEIAKQEIIAHNPDMFSKIENYVLVLNSLCD